MANKNVHVVPNDGKWSVKQEGRATPLSTHQTQAAAANAGRAVAKANASELVIHARNGQIRDKDSYGNDPCPPRDQKH